MRRTLFIVNEPVLPVRGGGTARLAGIASALGVACELVTAEPVRIGGGPLDDIDLPYARTAFTAERPPRWRGVVGLRPFLGARSVGVAPLDALPPGTVPPGTVVLASHSYLVPYLGPLPGSLVVDFPNLEVDRHRWALNGYPLRPVLAAVEWAKARWWEPAVARQADVALAVTDSDADLLRSWAPGTRVLVVPNAATPAPTRLSPEVGPAVIATNATYAPNEHAIRWLVSEVWPLVRADRPDARLVVAGLGTRELLHRLGASDTYGIVAAGFVDDLGVLYNDAAVVLAPVAHGAGTQLKVIEALAHRRVVVATPYSARSAPAGSSTAVVVADGPVAFASATADLLGSPVRRRQLERDIGPSPVPTWSEAVVPLLDALRDLGAVP